MRTSPHDKSISLLIKQKEERTVEKEMRNKQHEFSERMENCILRRNQLKKKKERVHYIKIINYRWYDNYGYVQCHVARTAYRKFPSHASR